MSQNATEVIEQEAGGDAPSSGGNFFSRASVSSRILMVIGAVVVLGVIAFALVKALSGSSTSSPTLPIASTPITSPAPTTTSATATTQFVGYGNRDPFVALTVVSQQLVSASPNTTVYGGTTNTTVYGGTTSGTGGVVTPTSTVTTTPSQVALVAVSPLGQPAVAQVTVNGTSYAGLTPGVTFDNGSYTITAIDQTSGCATFTNGGSSPFQICLNQAVLK